MGNILITLSTGYLDYTPTASSTYSTSYEDDNLKVYNNTQRHWRSNSSAQQIIWLDCGASRNISGCVLMGTNFTTVSVQYGASTVIGAVTTAYQFVTNENERTGMRGGIQVLSTTGRYAKVTIPAQTASDGSTYYKIGTIVLLSSSTITLQKNPPSIDFTIDEEMSSNKFEGGNGEDVSLGNPMLTCTFGYDAINSTYESDFWKLARHSKANTLVLSENTTDISKVYIMKRTSPVGVSRQAGVARVASIAFKEVG